MITGIACKIYGNILFVEFPPIFGEFACQILVYIEVNANVIFF